MRKLGRVGAPATVRSQTGRAVLLHHGFVEHRQQFACIFRQRLEKKREGKKMKRQRNTVHQTDYEDLPQSLHTPMLFNDWLIDWLRGFASKSAHPHVIQWLIDWLSTRICLKVCALWKSILPENEPIKLDQLRPTYAHSNHAPYKTKVKTASKIVFNKRWKKIQTMFTQSINQPSNYMRVRRLWSNNGVRRLWDISS